MNRRAFLTALATAAIAPAANAACAPLTAPRRKKVVIVGGGLAGLSCAYELQKYGLDVVVLEGQGRAGGRVQTLREGFVSRSYGGTGATRIPDTHQLTLSYVSTTWMYKGAKNKPSLMQKTCFPVWANTLKRLDQRAGVRIRGS